MAKGKIYMIPTTLGGDSLDIIPENVKQTVIGMRYFIVENIKTARRYLRRIDRAFPIDDSTFFILNKRTDPAEVRGFLKPVFDGHDIGVISEAGCPGVADPGALVVGEAHKSKVEVYPMVGPNSILLALMGSGFSGQEFAFHGYLPKERKDRIRKLRELDQDSTRTGKTNLFMDTPFRNMNVLEDLLNELPDDSQLCIASDLTLPDQKTRSMSVKDWRENAYDLAKRPTIFALGKMQ